MAHTQTLGLTLVGLNFAGCRRVGTRVESLNVLAKELEVCVEQQRHSIPMPSVCQGTYIPLRVGPPFGQLCNALGNPADILLIGGQACLQYIICMHE